MTIMPQHDYADGLIKVLTEDAAIASSVAAIEDGTDAVDMDADGDADAGPPAASTGSPSRYSGRRPARAGPSGWREKAAAMIIAVLLKPWMIYNSLSIQS